MKTLYTGHIRYKKTCISLIKLSFSFLVIFSSACTLEDDISPDKAIVREVREDIDTLTFWNGASTYIIQKPDFKVKDSLIIQAGAVIKFNPDSGRSITVAENGYIAAQGSPAKSIIFTSLYDKKYGNNSKDIDVTRKPNNGDWDEIIINGQKNSSFNLCEFYYGGGGNQHSTLSIGVESSANITNCTFAYNNGGDLETGLGVIDASQSSSKTIIRYNTFYSNNLPVYINTLFSFDNTNIFHNPLNTSQENKYNAIKAKTTLPIDGSINWSENEVAYVIMGPYLKITSKGSLLFGNNVVLKFMPNVSMILEGANSTLRNNDGPGVIFTSVFDDNYKGDTNGDGNATQPQKGDWSISVGDTITFEWRNILYATNSID